MAAPVEVALMILAQAVVVLVLGDANVAPT